MKIKTPLLLLAAALVLAGGLTLFANHAEAAQIVTSRCSGPLSDGTYYNGEKFSLTNISAITSDPLIIDASGCEGKPQKVKVINPPGYKNCSTGEPISLNHAYSWNNTSRLLKFWFLPPPSNACQNYIDSTTSVVVYWSGDTGGTITGYYCDRATDPARPTCKATTNPLATQTEYQCSLACRSDVYNVAVTPYEEPWRKSWDVGEIIDLKAVISPTTSSFPAVELANWIWDFGDGSDKVYSYYNYGNVGVARRAYAQPGTYAVTAQAYNNGGIKELNYPGFAGTRELIISGPSCVKPKGSRTNFNRIMEDLKNYRPVDIAANSSKEWVSDNLAKIIVEMVDSQCRLSLLRRAGIDYYRESTLAIKNIKRYTDSNLPYLFALYKVRGEGGHQMIAININEVEINKTYKIRVIDPNGPEVKVITCKNKKEYIDNLGEKARGVYCDYYDNEGNTWVGLPLLDNIDTDIMNSLILAKNQYCQNNSQSKFCLERQNLSRWLRLNYTFIHNPGISAVDLAANGSCVGWSDFNLRMAYLANFVGECEGDVVAEKNNWFSEQLAAIGSWPWVGLLGGFMR
jgi:hypothetical protein